MPGPAALPPALADVAYTEAAVLLLACAAGAAWVLASRKTRVAVNSQGPLLVLVLAGCAVSAVAVVMLVVENSAGCNLAPLLFVLGMQLALVSLIGRSWRILKIFNSQSSKPTRISTAMVIKSVMGIWSLEIIVCAAWAASAPLSYQNINAGVDSFGMPYPSQGVCVASNSATLVLYVFIFSWHLLSFILYAYFLVKVRLVPEEFQENRWMSYAVLANLELLLACVPAFVVVYFNVVARFVVASCFVFLSVLCIVLFLIAPKAYQLRTGNDFLERPVDRRLSKSGSFGNLTRHNTLMRSDFTDSKLNVLTENTTNANNVGVLRATTSLDATTRLRTEEKDDGLDQSDDARDVHSVRTSKSGQIDLT